MREGDISDNERRRKKREERRSAVSELRQKENRKEARNSEYM